MLRVDNNPEMFQELPQEPLGATHDVEAPRLSITSTLVDVKPAPLPPIPRIFVERYGVPAERPYSIAPSYLGKKK